jgi:hypothetical protein
VSAFEPGPSGSILLSIIAGLFLPSSLADSKLPKIPLQSVFVPTRVPSGFFHIPLHARSAWTCWSAASNREMTVRL